MLVPPKPWSVHVDSPAYIFHEAPPRTRTEKSKSCVILHPTWRRTSWLNWVQPKATAMVWSIYICLIWNKFEIIAIFFWKKKVSSPLYCVLTVFAVIALAFPTEDNGHQVKEHGPAGNGTTEDDYGWYAPVAMILAPISKDKVVDGKRNVIPPRVSGYGSLPHWRHRSPWNHPALPPSWYPYGNCFTNCECFRVNWSMEWF